MYEIYKLFFLKISHMGVLSTGSEMMQSVTRMQGV